MNPSVFLSCPTNLSLYLKTCPVIVFFCTKIPSDTIPAANFWIMESYQGERGEDITVFSKSEHIIRGGCRTAATSGAATTIGNFPAAPQSVEAASNEMATPVTRTDGKHTFGGLSDRFVSEQHPALRSRPTHSASSAKGEYDERTDCQYFVLVDDGIVHTSRDIGRFTKSNPDTKTVPLLQTVVNKALAEGFWSAAFYLAVEEVEYNFVPDPPSAHAVAEKLVDALSSTVSETKLVKHNF